MVYHLTFMGWSDSDPALSRLRDPLRRIISLLSARIHPLVVQTDVSISSTYDFRSLLNAMQDQGVLRLALPEEGPVSLISIVEQEHPHYAPLVQRIMSESVYSHLFAVSADGTVTPLKMEDDTSAREMAARAATRLVRATEGWEGRGEEDGF